LILLAFQLAQAHAGIVYPVNPETWCQVWEEQALPGDILNFESGTYVVDCDISDSAERDDDVQTIFRPVSEDAEVIFVPAEGATETFRLEASHFYFGGMTIRAPESGVAIRITGGERLWLRYLDLEGDIVLEQNSPSLHISETRFFDHELVDTCVDCTSTMQLSEILVEGGSLQTNRPLELHDALLFDATVDAVELYTTRSGFTNTSLRADRLQIENAIIDGGSVEGAQGHVWASTVYGTNLDTAPLDKQSNAIFGTGIADTCDSEQCWADSGLGDFSPGSKTHLGTAVVADDFCGRERPTPPTAGALEATSEPLGPLPREIKLFSLYCPADNLVPEPPETRPTPKSCASAPTALWLAWVPLLAIRRRSTFL